MKIVITEEQIKLIKESTNKSAKLLGKFYDIEADGAYYLGDGIIQSRVILTPKDLDNPMTPKYGESICNWEIYMPSDLTFVSMSLPDSFHVPLMDHIGNTGELEEYLKGLHREESEEFLKRIIHRRNNPLNESVDRKKKLFIELLGQDLIDSIRMITSSKELPKEFSKVIGSNIIQKYIDVYGPLYYFVLDGEPFIYKDRDDYEMFVDSNGKGSVKNEITLKLGLADMGLKFSDVIDTFHNDEEPLNENVDKNKKFLTNVMGQDFTNNIKQITSAYNVPYNFYGKGTISLRTIMSYLNSFGPMYLFELDGKKYLYQDRFDKDWFIDEDGHRYIDNEIPEKLGIDVMGLRFSVIIDLYFNEEEPLNESVDKNKKFLINVMGEDLTGKIKEIKDSYDVPMEFGEAISPDLIRRMLSYFGPMYLVDIDGRKYLYQYRGDDDGDYEWFHNQYGFNYVDGQIPEQLGLNELGLKFSDVIDIFYNQEGKPLNEGSDMSGKSKENIKLENLLKRVLENKEFEYSFTDRTEGVWDGHEYEHIEEDYTFEYHMVVNYVLGVGSGSVADISVIIDDIILGGESVYDGWVEIGYSENVWYIEHLHDYLRDDVFNVFPFSIYPTFYGHDEEK
jgi:hypothetical protein